MKIIFSPNVLNKLHPLKAEFKANGHELVMMTSDKFNESYERYTSTQRDEFALVMEDISRVDPDAYIEAARTLKVPVSELLLLDFKEGSCLAALRAGVNAIWLENNLDREKAVTETRGKLIKRNLLPQPEQKSGNSWTRFWKKFGI